MPCTAVYPLIYLQFCINYWCFPDIYVYTKRSYLMIGKPQWQQFIFQLFGLKQLLINNTFFSNDSMSTLINAPDLEHCDAWALFLLMWKHWYYLTGGVSVDNSGVVAVDIVSQKDEERHFPPVVSHITSNHRHSCYNYCNDGWCFDIIQLMLHHLHLLRHLKHCCVGFV